MVLQAVITGSSAVTQHCQMPSRFHFIMDGLVFEGCQWPRIAPSPSPTGMNAVPMPHYQDI